VGAGDLTEPLSVRARFERFPATVKGAFILRGEDADPHQVVLRAARVVGIGLGTSYPMPMASATLDVAPHRDVFVPFEMPVGELDPGWYTMTCDLDVDGLERSYDGGRRFSVPWPRASVRRGQVKVDARVDLGDASVVVEHVDCAGDSVRVHLRVDPPSPVGVKLAADGDPLEVLDVDIDDASGRGKVTAYPVMRSHAALRISFRRGRGPEAAIDVPLPA
jgi:hypothetical protein